MDENIKQQIVISGVGGQGVLFVTRIIAQAAMKNGFPVLTSETHGMAQRGGSVVSHLKVGDFSSPLIRPGQADGLIALKDENIHQYTPWLVPSGWAVGNAAEKFNSSFQGRLYGIDADRIAHEEGDPRSVNIVMLGFAIAAMEDRNKEMVLCSLDDVKQIMREKLSKKPDVLKKALGILDAGYQDMKRSVR